MLLECRYCKTICAVVVLWLISAEKDKVVVHTDLPTAGFVFRPPRCVSVYLSVILEFPA